MSEVIDMEQRRNDFSFRKWIRLGLSLIILVVLFVFVITNLYIVRENEFKVVRQFGQVVDVKDEPGLYFKIPFIQTVTTLPKNLILTDIPTSEINTLDKKRVLIDYYAVWRVVDANNLIKNARTVEGAQARMEELIYSIMPETLGRLNYDEIINDEKSSRGSINDQVTEKVNEGLEKNEYGIEVVDVRIKRTDLPPENEQSVYTRMISERESKAQEYLSKGDAEKNRIMAETDREVTEMLATAKADAEIIRGEGEGEAAKIYNEAFSKDPEFYQLFRTLESYKKTIGDKTMIILPVDSPYARLLQGYVD